MAGTGRSDAVFSTLSAAGEGTPTEGAFAPACSSFASSGAQPPLLQAGRRYEPLRVLGRGSYGLALLARLPPAAPPYDASALPAGAGEAAAAAPARRALSPNPLPPRSGGADMRRPPVARCSCFGAALRGQRPSSAPRRSLSSTRLAAAYPASTPPLATSTVASSTAVVPEAGELRVIKKVELPGEDEASCAEVLQEIRVLRGLSHPNIIGYYEAFTEGTTVCIAMEYADGGDLAGNIARRREAGQRFQEREAMAVFAQLTLAVQYLHEERRILHRDLKSANIFLTSAGVVKLGDFGIAKVLRPSVRHAKTRVGSPYYLPPEICESQPYDFKADVWCLGVVFYEVLALEVPFAAQNIAALVVRIITQEPPPLPPAYGSETRALASRLLAKRPSERPSIGEVASLPHVRRSIAGLAALGAAAAGGPSAGTAAIAVAGQGGSLRPLAQGHGTAPADILPRGPARGKAGATKGFVSEEPSGVGSTCGSGEVLAVVAGHEDSSFFTSAAVDLAEVEDLIRESPAKRPRPSAQPRVFGEMDREGAELFCTTPTALSTARPVLRTGLSGPRSGETFDLAELEVLLGLKKTQDVPSVSPPLVQRAASTDTAVTLAPQGTAAAPEPPPAAEAAAPVAAAAAPTAEAPARVVARKGSAALASRTLLVAAAPTPLRMRVPQMRRSLEADFGQA